MPARTLPDSAQRPERPIAQHRRSPAEDDRCAFLPQRLSSNAPPFTGPNGAQETDTYDTYGRLSQSSSVHGSVTTYAYNYPALATVTATTNATQMYPPPPPVHWVRKTLDGLGRVIKQGRGDNSSTISVVDTEYDSGACSPLGKVSRVSQPYVLGAKTIYWTTYTYDSLGRTLTEVKSDGQSTTHYSYSGNTTTVTDPAGHLENPYP